VYASRIAGAQDSGPESLCENWLAHRGQIGDYAAHVRCRLELQAQTAGYIQVYADTQQNHLVAALRNAATAGRTISATASSWSSVFGDQGAFFMLEAGQVLNQRSRLSPILNVSCGVEVWRPCRYRSF
jgi:hypothetical protein